MTANFEFQKGDEVALNLASGEFQKLVKFNERNLSERVARYLEQLKTTGYLSKVRVLITDPRIKQTPKTKTKTKFVLVHATATNGDWVNFAVQLRNLEFAARKPKHPLTDVFQDDRIWAAKKKK